MENNSYFNYFTEIEEHFQRRRGTILLLSTLDWALIETWKDAGVPLEAVLRGIDAAFDKYDARPQKTRKVNSLAYCSQEVLAAAEEMKVAAEGSTRVEPAESGFEAPTVGGYLSKNADLIESVLQTSGGLNSNSQLQNGKTQRVALPEPVCALATDTAHTLRELAKGMSVAQNQSLEDLERRLTVMEEKLFGALLAATPDAQIVDVRAEADRELAPYCRKMSGAQIEQLQKQYIHKRLLERYGLPRLSLFYM